MTTATRAAVDDIAVAVGYHARQLWPEWFDPAQMTP
jgi:hypothetical protein